MEDKISMETKRQVTLRFRDEYMKASKKDKGRILDEMCSVLKIGRSTVRRRLAEAGRKPRGLLEGRTTPSSSRSSGRSTRRPPTGSTCTWYVTTTEPTTHKTPSVNAWLERHPRFHMHFTPTYSSWPDQAGRLFAEITRQMLQRSDHRSVQTMERDVREWGRTWNENPRPFKWNKTADQILASLARFLQRTTGI